MLFSGGFYIARWATAGPLFFIIKYKFSQPAMFTPMVSGVLIALLQIITLWVYFVCKEKEEETEKKNYTTPPPDGWMDVRTDACFFHLYFLFVFALDRGHAPVLS